MSDSDDDGAPAARLAPMDKGAKRARDWSGIEDDDDGTGVEADKRNTAQHALIMQTMQEAMGGKGRKQAAPAGRKGKTLQEIEVGCGLAHGERWGTGLCVMSDSGQGAASAFAARMLRDGEGGHA